MAGQCCGPGTGPVFLGVTTGMCRECRRTVEARYLAVDDRVYLERRCPEHGLARALVAEDLQDYLAAIELAPAGAAPSHVVPRRGPCPTSCGPCEFHGQACNLPVFSITNACDLRCPICFTYNRADALYYMSDEEFDRHLDLALEATGGVDLVNVTGGEPTLHPRLLELLARARRPGVGRVTVNTNGLRIAREPELAQGLADVGAYAVLSLDTLLPERSVRLHGRDICAEKLRALDALGAAGVPTTLLMVLVGGCNEDELGAMVQLLGEREHVRSLTIQTMTYTGQGGGSFGPREHIPVDGVARRIEEATRGAVERAHFHPLPTAHPLCYRVAYLVADGSGALHPFGRMLPPERMMAHLRDGYLLHPSDELAADLREAIDRLWSEDRHPELLGALKRVLKTVYPPGESLELHERQRRAERTVKTIYVHAHMDEDTWEVGRAMRCPDQVPTLPAAEEEGGGGRLIGACNYNLFYRMNDERFWDE